MIESTYFSHCSWITDGGPFFIYKAVKKEKIMLSLVCNDSQNKGGKANVVLQDETLYLLFIADSIDCDYIINADEQH